MNAFYEHPAGVLSGRHHRLGALRFKKAMNLAEHSLVSG
jgi:hypothetical protein